MNILQDTLKLIDELHEKFPWKNIKAHVVENSAVPEQEVFIIEMPAEFRWPHEDQWTVVMHPVLLADIRRQAPGMPDREIAQRIVHQQRQPSA